MTKKAILFGALFIVWPAYSQDFQWKGTLAPGRTLEIKNVNGSIAAEPSAAAQAEVTAVKRAGWRGDPKEVRIEVVESDSGVTICAVYPDSGLSFVEEFFMIYSPSPNRRLIRTSASRARKAGSAPS